MEIVLSSRLDGVGEYYFSKKLQEIAMLKAEGKDIINLGIGSPDLPPHSSVIDTLCRESLKAETHSYQLNKGSVELRTAFSEWYKRYYDVTISSDSQILPLIGSKEGVMHVCMTYLNKGDKVLIPNPGYPTYRSAVTLSGGECREYMLKQANDYQVDLEALEAEGLDGVKMMIINYPHMPTGANAKEGLFEKLVAFARKHNILLLHDNPYSFIRNETPKSILSVEGAMEVALELNSLSKSHNMAGWRVGALFGNQQRISEVLRFRSNMDSGQFLPMQRAACTALALGEEWFEQLNKEYKEREALGYEIMKILGCEAQKEQAGLFIWGRLPEDEKDCYAFIDNILHQKNIFITPGAIFGSEGSRYIRISLCANKQTLERIIERLKTEKL